MYKSGQKLICIKKNNWWSYLNDKSAPGPKYGEEVTVQSVKGNYLYLVGYLEYGCYNSNGFRPPVNISKDVMNSFQEEIVETIDVPNVEPTLEPA